VKVRVIAFGRLTASLGNETAIELTKAAIIGDLLSILEEKTEAIQKEALIYFDRTEPQLTILINGQNIQTLDGLKTPLREGDLILLLPAVHGG
jgi:molybdopterin synthase sulfur carrier subunit